MQDLFQVEQVVGAGDEVVSIPAVVGIGLCRHLFPNRREGFIRPFGPQALFIFLNGLSQVVQDRLGMHHRFDPQIASGDGRVGHHQGQLGAQGGDIGDGSFGSIPEALLVGRILFIEDLDGSGLAAIAARASSFALVTT